MSLTVREVHEYQLGVQRLFVHDWAEGTDLYKRAGTASTPEELADHDGPVLLADDKFRTVEENEYGYWTAYHPHAGRMERWSEGEPLETDAVLLKRVPKS